jgi:hypothetical protein
MKAQLQCHCIVAHELRVVPDCIYRWNSSVNFWAFHLSGIKATSRAHYPGLLKRKNENAQRHRQLSCHGGAWFINTKSD